MRGRVVKSVGRPADIYSLGAVFYYLISGAYANPKNLFDAFRKFVEYERRDENNSIAAYIEHEYRTIQNLRAPKADGQGAPELAPEDRFFSYKHYLDGNGELIDPSIMMIIAKAMIRNKPDSYCLSYDLRTTGISAMVHDLLSLYVAYGIDPSARIAYSNEATTRRRSPARCAARSTSCSRSSPKRQRPPCGGPCSRPLERAYLPSSGFASAMTETTTPASAATTHELGADCRLEQVHEAAADT